MFPDFKWLDFRSPTVIGFYEITKMNTGLQWVNFFDCSKTASDLGSLNYSKLNVSFCKWTCLMSAPLIGSEKLITLSKNMWLLCY